MTRLYDPDRELPEALGAPRQVGGSEVTPWLSRPSDEACDALDAAIHGALEQADKDHVETTVEVLLELAHELEPEEVELAHELEPEVDSCIEALNASLSHSHWERALIAHLDSV